MKNLISISMFVMMLLTLVLGCQREDIEPSSYVFSPVVIAPIVVAPDIKLKSKFNYDSLSKESFSQKIDSLEARADTTFYIVEVVDNTPENWSGLDYFEEKEEEYPDSVFFGCPWKIMPVRYHIMADLFDSIKLELPSFQLNMLISFNVVQLDVDALEFLEPSGPYLDWNTIHSKSGSILDSDDPLGLKDPKYLAFVQGKEYVEKTNSTSWVYDDKLKVSFNGIDFDYLDSDENAKLSDFGINPKNPENSKDDNIVYWTKLVLLALFSFLFGYVLVILKNKKGLIKYPIFDNIILKTMRIKPREISANPNDPDYLRAEERREDFLEDLKRQSAKSSKDLQRRFFPNI